MNKPANTSMLLKDIMTTPVISVTLGHTVYQVLQLAKDKNVTGFPIVDIDNKVIGVTSTLDLITDVTVGKLHLKLGELPLLIKVEKQVVKFHEDTPIKEALLSLIKHRIGRIIVIDVRDRLCGIVSRKDLVRFFIDVFSVEGEGGES